jgi:3-oxoacyl-[acyl-carrier protein] reductase
MELGSKAAIVTGGGTGLGRAITLGLARTGCQVAVVHPGGADAGPAAETAADARALGVAAAAIEADVSQVRQVEAMAAQAIQTFGGVDLLFNNAGTTAFIPMDDLDSVSDDVWDRIIGVNVKGAFLCARACAPSMRQRGGGRIVNTASVSGLRAGGSSLPYSVSKSALLGLTRCLALGLAPDILVNAVAPGFMPTRWGLLFGPQAAEHAAETAPIKRLVAIEDVAEAAISLARNDSITGQTLVVDGGIVMH